MTEHKIGLATLLEGAPVVLPFELSVSLKPGHGPYATCDGEGPGVTVTIARSGVARTEHFPNRYQAWQRARALMGRAVQ